MTSGNMKMLILPPLSTVTRSSESLIERIKDHQDAPKSPSSSTLSGVFSGSPLSSPETSERKLPTLVKTHSTAQKAKEGYLKRREKGMITTSWKRVPCVIKPEKPGMLTIYANDKRVEKDATVVQLQKAPVLVFHKDDHEGRFLFDITPIYGEKEVKDTELLFDAESLDDRTHWVDTIEDHGALVKRPVKEGWLMKTGSGMKKWYKRYFVLYPDALHYYKNSPYEKATGIIGLPGTAEIEIDEIDGQQHLFYVAENGDEGTRRYYIRAESESERYDWVCTLIDLLAGRRVKMHGDSVKEGYLMKSSSNMKIWAKRYFVLMPSKMLYYKKFGDLEAAGEIEIAGSSEVEIENDLTRPHMFSVAKSGDSDERKYCMCARNGKERGEWIKTIKDLQADKATRVNKSSLMEGYLNKCSANQKKWNKRYFILLSDRLQYYKKREDALPAGEIELTGDVEVETENDESRPHMFSLQKTGDEGERQYLMTGRNDAERAEWINSIQTIIDTKRVRIHPESIREGYLFKSGSRMTHWTKRFFILLEDRMLYFKKKHDRDPAGEISLPGGAEVEKSDGMGHDHMFYVARNGDEGERKYYIKTKTSSERNEWMKHIQIILTKKKSIVHGNSVKEGYLYKCNVNMKHWTKRYFALFEDKLLYYKKKEDKQEAGEILLPGGAIVEIAFEQGRLHMFSIAANGDEAERKFLLVCRDNPERAQWMSAISDICSKKNWKRDEKSVKEGYLLKSGSKGTHWSKRYFMLYADKLLYYKRKHDAEPAGTIDIPAGAECDEDDTKQNDQPNLFWVAKNGDEETRKYYIRAKDDIERSDWVDTVRELIDQKDNKTDPKSIKEGHMLKKGGLMGMVWKQHYYVALPKELRFFKGRDEKVPEGSVPIDKTLAPSVEFDTANALSILELGKRQVYQCRDDHDRESWAMTLKHLAEGHVEEAKKSATARSKNEVSPAELEAERNGVIFNFPEGLKDKWEMSLYKKFEQEQFTAENINCYEAVLLWKKLFNESPLDETKIAEEAGRIYKEFVMENSPSEVNIISTMRQKSALVFEGKEALEAREKGATSSTLGLDFEDGAQQERKLDLVRFKGKLKDTEFDEITTVVVQLMNTNSFYRFKKSKMFDQLLARRVREKRKMTKLRIQERRDMLKKKEAGLIDELPPLNSPSSIKKDHEEEEAVPPPDSPPPPSPLAVQDTPPPPPESPLSRVGAEPVYKLLKSKAGRVYYSNVRTRETTWVAPTSGTVWEKLKTVAGKTYYLDVLKKKTQWAEPPELGEARAIQQAKRVQDAQQPKKFTFGSTDSKSATTSPIHQQHANTNALSPPSASNSNPSSPRNSLGSQTGSSAGFAELSLAAGKSDGLGGPGSRTASPSPRGSSGSLGGGSSPLGKMMTPLPIFDSTAPPAATSSQPATIAEDPDAEADESHAASADAHPPPPEEEESKVPFFKLIMTKDKKVYYVNVSTKHSQWTKPEVGEIYQKLRLADERIYYLNVKTNTTAWTKPHPDFD